MNEIETLRAYLARHIPLTQAMGVEVVTASAHGIRLRCPLAPNSNHKGTAFGGSLSSMMILAAWAWIWLELQRQKAPSELVIQKSEVEFLRPVRGDLIAVAHSPSPDAVAKFIKVLAAKGKARIDMTAMILDEAGDVLAQLNARFAAVD